jgi:hypothetical protein
MGIVRFKTYIKDKISWEGPLKVEVAPPSRSGHDACYISSRNELFIYGGKTDSKTLGDFWGFHLGIKNLIYLFHQK